MMVTKLVASSYAAASMMRFASGDSSCSSRSSPCFSHGLPAQNPNLGRIAQVCVNEHHRPVLFRQGQGQIEATVDFPSQPLRW